MSERHEIVVAYWRMKQAALYFDYIVPDYHCFGEAAKGSLAREKWADNIFLSAAVYEDIDVPSEVLPENLRNDDEWTIHLNRAKFAIALWWAEKAREQGKWDQLVRYVGEEIGEGENIAAVEAMLDLGEAGMTIPRPDFSGVGISVEALPAIIPEDWAKPVEGLRSTEKNRDFRVSLVDANLIDTQHASWEQVLELRADEDSRKKLCRLRRFLDGQYEGKSKAYIEDDLQTRMEDHDAVAKKFGFELRRSILDAFLSSTFLKASTSAAGLAAIEGHPWLGLAGAAMAAGLVLGEASFKIEESHFEFDEAVEKNPLKYVIDAKRKLEKPEQS